MESLPSSTEKQFLITSFLEVAVGQTAETANQFLQATSWKLEDAIQLFYVGNDGGVGLASASASALPPVEQIASAIESAAAFNRDGKEADAEEVRAPLPVKRDTLYGDATFMRLQPSTVVAFRNFEEESRRPAVWESEQHAVSTANGSRDNLASLYRPPFALMYNGSFDKAKVEASLLDKWLLVNLQSTEEFSSHMLNRDTWSNEAVMQTILTNFIFWQEYSDTSEGRKVCTYYNVVSVPAILVIDPITGQKMRAWTGMVQPERLLEDLLPFMEGGPKQQHVSLPLKRRREGAKDSMVSISASEKHLEEDEELQMALAASLEGTKVPSESCVDAEAKADKDAKSSTNKVPVYPPLSEEPKGNRELLCRVGIRLPDGRRVQRNFLRSDSIKLLWSFCSSQLEHAGDRSFHFLQTIPGASKTLNYETNITFDEAGLSNSMISMLWD